ncbi:MAG: hypothetical protein NTX24_02650 [Candidatus Pacearchaeota archaeon]|nr:hypothetical protein [Candidatus Pacearchaeota archaeon]
MKQKEVKLYSWIIRGSQRAKMLKVMDKPLTPTQIKKLTSLALNNVSDNLRLFVKYKVAKCLNEKDKLGRIYILTEKGMKIKKLT